MSRADMQDQIRDLQKKAVIFAQIPDRKIRHQAGYALDYDLKILDGRYQILGGLDSQSEVEFKAIITILIEYILYDALEDEDWALTLPDHYDGDIESVLKGGT